MSRLELRNVEKVYEGDRRGAERMSRGKESQRLKGQEEIEGEREKNRLWKNRK